MLKNMKIVPKQLFDYQHNISEPIYIYTDGACFNNGQSCARAGYGVFLGVDHPLNVSKKIVDNPTNQRAELAAIKEACIIVQHNFMKKNVVILSDSMYSINCITKWYKTWQSNNWLNAKGNPVQNKKLIQEILTNKTSNIQFNYVAAHQSKNSTNKHAFGNNMADKLAKSAAS